MAFDDDVVFWPANKITCQRGQIYRTIIQICLEHGWSNLCNSYPPPTQDNCYIDEYDWDILVNKYDDPNLKVTLRLAPFSSWSLRRTVNDVTNTRRNIIQLQLVTNYLRDRNINNKGRFQYTGKSIAQYGESQGDDWFGMAIDNSEADPTESGYTISYAISDYLCIFIIKYLINNQPNQPSAAHKPIFFGWGLPNDKYTNITANRSCIAFGNTLTNGYCDKSADNTTTFGNDVINMINSPPGASFFDSNVNRIGIIKNIPYKNPTRDNRYILTPMYYGNAEFGILGEIPGILSVAGVSNYDNVLIDGAQILHNGHLYEIFKSDWGPSNIKNLVHYAFRIN
jgi:hypothetical protein